MEAARAASLADAQLDQARAKSSNSRRQQRRLNRDELRNGESRFVTPVAMERPASRDTGFNNDNEDYGDE